MINLKNTLVGFLVSFLGSVPLGYLNIVGYEVYKKSGINQTVFYLLGVITIEFLVIYGTLIFASRLLKNTGLIRFIEAFSVLFMFVLAYVFYSSAEGKISQQSVLGSYIDYSAYAVGVILSCINFINIPFWTSWNLYLLNGKHIEISSNARKSWYVLGTLIGTFAGMLGLILSLDFLTSQAGFFEKYLMKAIIPLAFTGLGIFQGIKYYQKYHR